VDGSILLNMNDAFDNPVNYTSVAYPTRGQVFIHELTHAWQIRTKSFIPGLLCKSVFETHSYAFSSVGKPWSDFGLEQQAAIVDNWFRDHAAGWSSMEDLVAKLSSQDAIHDPLFGYIANNIRFGQN
jgi:hypothetical protein